MLSLKELDAFKLEYPELRFKETDPKIAKFLTDVYKFDGYMVRRPKIILIIDDQSGTKIFTTPNNSFYNLLCLRRHQGLFYIGISYHSVGNTQYSYKLQMNSMLLFRGIPPEKLTLLYDNVASLDSIDFNAKTFLSMYQEITGYNEVNMDKKEAYRYNFMYVMSQPITAIYENFDKRLK